MPRTKSSRSRIKKINLALQGGGAHGAYTWGVLDRLLEDEFVQIEGISGTSAGAMNAVVLADGYLKNGSEGARQSLENFWREISAQGYVFNPMQATPLDSYQHRWNLGSTFSYSWFDLMSRLFSPYQLNPFNLNPLRDILENQVDFQALQTSSEKIKLFIAATHVESGQARIFKCNSISAEAVLASACIPFLFQAVEIKGEAYWDGGYMGNPVLWPLFYETEASDILLVQINPLFREGIPTQAGEIINRLNEITFNSSLMSEIRAISFVKQLVEKNKLPESQYKNIHMHMIAAPQDARDYDASSKMNTDWGFFLHLKEIGRNAAEQWLKGHWKDVGKQSSIDIWDTFLKPRNHPSAAERAA